MSAAQKLREARALIERGWCQGYYAHSATGRNVEPHSRRAIQFCISGACFRAGVPGGAGIMFKAIPADNVSIWNDAPGRTQTEVLAAFDRAIALAEQEEARP